MLRVSCLFLLFLAIFGPIEAVRELPSYIVPCRKSDPEINKCIIKRANEVIPKLKNGDKKFKLPSVTPLRISEAIVEPGANLKLSFRNFDVFGLDKIVVKDADINFKEHTLKMNLFIPQMQVVGDYEIDGRILILPIVGKGKGNITFDNMDVSYQLNFEEQIKNEINQFGVINNSVDYVSSRIYYTFDNLFNGEKRLVAEMKIFLDENWKEIDKELHGSFNEIIAKIILSFMLPIAQDLPYDDIFQP